MPKVLTLRFNGLFYNKIFVCLQRGAKDKAKKAASKAPDKIAQPPPPDMRMFKVYRFAGICSNTEPKIETYEIDVSKIGGMVLDVMLKIKDMDPTFTFRRSCREGICGSCAVMLQGGNCLACIKPIPKAKVITILPLPHMYVIRDLVVDMTHFINGYNSIKPYLIRKDCLPLGTGQFAQSIQDNKKVVGLYECVLCACCSTSCPSYWWNGRRFLGPATLLHAYRWITDGRDEDTECRLYDLKDDFKVYRCHTIMNCALTCPKFLNPAIPIAKLKRLLAGLDKVPKPQMDPMTFMTEQKPKQPNQPNPKKSILL